MSAERSIGTTLELVQVGDNDLVGNLTSIGEIGLENSEIDVTTLDSEDNYKEFIAGFKDAGEVSIAGYVKDETNMEDMLALADGQSVEKWIVTFPQGSTWEFDGFVKMWKEAESTVEGVRGFTGSIRISGKPVYTPVTPSA